MDPVLLAAPFFLLLAALEALALARRGERPYRLNDFLSGLSCGVLDQAVNASLTAAFLALYAAAQHRLGLLPFSPRSPLAWAACVLAHDLAYYAFHRASHRVNVLWAAHAVHHQSEEYNFTVSLRQGAIATWVTFAFYLPLAVAGFPVAMFALVHGVHQVYQFLVHTRLVRRAGWLEGFLATPSHHRVHHGRDRGYLDRNYGGLFILWDKWLGTFAPETREPRYGVTEGIRSWSPLWANLSPFADLWRRSRRAPDLRAAVALWFAPPERRAAWDEPARLSEGYDRRAPRGVRGYVLFQTLAVAGVTMALLHLRERLAAGVVAALVGFVVASLATLTALVDRRPWARAGEHARLALGAAGAALAAAAGRASLLAAVLWALACVASLRAFARLKP